MSVARVPLAGTWLGAGLMLVPALTGSLEAQGQRTLQRETMRIQGPIEGMRLALRHVVNPSAAPAQSKRIVLVLHGTVVPISGNPAYPFGGRSLLDALVDEGLDVWALDFYGYGGSDRYPQMEEPAEKHPPVGTAKDSVRQIESAVAYMKQRYGIAKIMLIGDSGSTLVAGLFAARHPESTARLILFGPVTPFTALPAPQALERAYSIITPEGIWGTFADWASRVEDPPVLDSKMYDAWAAEFLRSDPTSQSRTPPSVRFPAGWQVDQAAAASGRYPYDPAEIRAPTLIVMGETDEITTFARAQWLLRSLRQAAQRRLVVIGRGSHTIQYEAERAQLYRVMGDFLRE
jgi:pimeloyl-ACP methyl ester carboxylesterase